MERLSPSGEPSLEKFIDDQAAVGTQLTFLSLIEDPNLNDIIAKITLQNGEQFAVLFINDARYKTRRFSKKEDLKKTIESLKGNTIEAIYKALSL